jgi:acetyl-CoA carboxylase, biotin carboxylase subunit
MYEGLDISIYYDPLISKLVSHAPTRIQAVDRMLRALKEFKIGGIKTNIPYFMRIFSDPDFRAGAIDTSFLDRSFAAVDLALPGEESMEELERIALMAAAVRYMLEDTRTPCACPEASRCSPWRMAGRRRQAAW